METIEDRQLTNLKNRIIDYIRKNPTPDLLIRLAIFCKIKVPNQLIDKFLQS